MSKVNFAHKVAVVTGASTGIGRELALQLASSGARVVIGSRNEESLRNVAEECRKMGGEALVVKLDVGDKEACKSLVDRTIEKYGKIDVLINNAGYAMTAPVNELEDISQIERLMQVNFMGSVYCTYYALPYLLETRGRIVGISSVAGYFSSPGSSAYNASKFAMRGFFDALRMELSKTGVSVTMIYPGYVVTEFAANVVNGKGKRRGEKALAIYSDSMMSASKCARITLKAAAKRKRQVLMTIQVKIARWIRMIFPNFIDSLIIKYLQSRREKIKELMED